MRTTLRARLIAPVALAALALTISPAQAAAAPVAGSDAQATTWAAHFLATQLAANAPFFNTPPSPSATAPDTGNTIDAVIALAGATQGGTEAAAVTGWLQGQAAGYVSYTDTWSSDTPATYDMGGSLGKLTVLAVVQQQDPSAFGGVDLISRLKALKTPSGRFGTGANDFGVTINQAWAILGLARSGQVVAPAEVDYLKAQQCADGGVSKDLDAAPCVSDVDATAFAAQAFLAAGDSAAADRALDHLQAIQAADGSFQNSSGEGANSNSTGVAAQAFAAGGRTAPLALANAFVRSLQWGCDVPEADRGGLAFTASKMAINEANVAWAIRATPQALLGLSGGSLVTVSNAGQAPATTAMDCTPVTEPTDTPTTTPESTTTIPPTAAPMLAETGKDVSVPVTLGAVLVLLGAALIGLRRRGLHS